MRFEVVVTTVHGAGGDTERVVATTRRENGAWSEVTRWLESARENAKTHNPDGWVVEGPTGKPNQVSVTSLFPGGHEAEWVVEVRKVERA